jgi:hypothetical protein
MSPPSSRPRLWLKDTDRPRNGSGDPGLVAGDGKVPKLPFDDDQRRELSLNNQLCLMSSWGRVYIPYATKIVLLVTLLARRFRIRRGEILTRDPLCDGFINRKE